MVWSRDREAERPPLSVILPQLYLGAESDVTQDRLASHGISYVLSVSRCSPQPSFLPHSRYLRIPIDDSLWDDLLPWIPQALHFIDAALSSGASVLVHCAAGISRSPALAVAYIMYSLGMDLDRAYRYVKERRPSISPNFNFLGQLQHFQSALDQKASCGISTLQQLKVAPPSVTEGITPSHGSQKTNRQVDTVTGSTTEVARSNKEKVCGTDNEKYGHTRSDGNRNVCLSPSGNLQTLTLNHNEQQVQTLCTGTAPGSLEQGKAVGSPRRPRHLRLQSGSASLAEKRKSLTLSLTPLGTNDRRADNDKTGGGHQAAALRSPGSCGQRVLNTRCNRDDEPEQGALLSPFSFTLNKLLDWGERILLGGVFVQPVRMGQAALHYR